MFHLAVIATTLSCIDAQILLEKMNEFRYNYFYGQKNPGALDQLRQFCKEHDKILSVPYFEKEVYDYFYDKSWEEINKPYQKYLIKTFLLINKLITKNAICFD